MVFVIKSLLLPIIPVLTLLPVPGSGPGAHPRPLFPHRGTHLHRCRRVSRQPPDHHGGQPRARRWILLEITGRWFVLVALVSVLVYLSGITRCSASHPSSVGLSSPRWPFSWLKRKPAVCWRIRAAGRIAASSRDRRHDGSGSRSNSALRADAFLRTEVAGYFEDRSVDRPGRPKRTPSLIRRRVSRKFVARSHIEQVFITLPMTSTARILSLLEQLHNSTASIYFRPGPDCVQSHPGPV